MADRILTLRELNRATLARQLLLSRASLPPLSALKQLVALQGQVQNAPYIGLWTRLKAFERAELKDLIEQRQVVRAASLRMTLHLLLAEDYALLHPQLQTIPRSRRLSLVAEKESLDLDHVKAVMQTYLQEKPRTGSEVRMKLREISSHLNQDEVVGSATMQLALIQTFPAGTWNFTGPLTYAQATSWLNRRLVSPEESVRHLIVRYLAAFGPASIKDIQTWSGVSRLGSAVELLRSELVTYRDEWGQELFDLPEAPLPEERTPAPVRFLPVFDNLLLAYEDRRRLIADAYRRFVFPGQAMVRATFLLDGFVQGIWKIERNANRSLLVIEPASQLSDQERISLQEEGERLMSWIGEPFEIQFTPQVQSPF